jgi:hypothetical protein
MIRGLKHRGTTFSYLNPDKGSYSFMGSSSRGGSFISYRGIWWVGSIIVRSSRSRMNGFFKSSIVRK